MTVTTYGFNALRLSGQRFGIGRYIEYVLKHWNTMLRPNERVLVYVREPWEKSSIELSDAFDPARLYRASQFSKRFIEEMGTLADLEQSIAIVAAHKLDQVPHRAKLLGFRRGIEVAEHIVRVTFVEGREDIAGQH